MIPQARRLFEVIDDVKDEISSGRYLELCNCARDLVSELPDCRDSDTESNNRESPNCFCDSVIDFEDTSTFYDISSYCTEDPEGCCNLRKIFERFPLLQNIVERTTYTYSSTPNLENYVEFECCKDIRLFITLMENVFLESRDRCLVIFALFSYLFDNFNFILDNELFRKKFQEKLIFLETDETYKNLAEDYSVPIKKWKKQLVT